MSKWGYALPDSVVCSTCGNGTHNPACTSCGSILCEACFQLGPSCCDEQHYPDGYIKKFQAAEERISSSVLTVSVMCNSTHCARTVGISTIEYPKIDNEPFRFCPVCGYQATVVPYNREGMWKHIGKRLGLPIDIIKEVYNDWNKEGSLQEHIKELLKG